MKKPKCDTLYPHEWLWGIFAGTIILLTLARIAPRVFGEINMALPPKPKNDHGGEENP